jgi:hypothetical protein
MRNAIEDYNRNNNLKLLTESCATEVWTEMSQFLESLL